MQIGKKSDFIAKTRGGRSQGHNDGFILGAYEFDRYKSKKSKHPVSRMIISTEEYGGKETDVKSAREAVRTGWVVSEAVNYVRT